MRILKIQDLKAICTNSNNAELCSSLEHFNTTTQIVDISYIIVMVLVSVLLLITALSFIYNYFRRNDNTKRFIICIAYIFLMSLLFSFYILL